MTDKLPPASGLSDLRLFLDVLRREREVVEIEAEVDPDLEAAEVHRRVIAAGGPALLFKNVKGSPWPALTNMFGTARRVELAFGSRPEALVERIANLPHTAVPPTPGKLWAQRDLAWPLLNVGARRTARGPVTEVVDRPPALTRLPLLRTWKRDGGPFVTLPLVHTEHPDGLGPNLGMYRIQRFDDERCGLHAQIGKGAGFHLALHEQRGTPMPVNVHIGGAPALVLGAIAPLPENVPEMLLASAAVGKRLRLSRNPAGPLAVFGDCEFVVTGHIKPGARHPEGPFGDHYGYYSEQHEYPMLTVDALLRRRDPILTATVVGKPRQEDFFIGDYLQELLHPMIKVVMPAVEQLWSYGETGYHSLAAAVVKQRYKREAMVSAFRILGEGQLALTKFLLLTDRPVDLRNFRETFEHVLERAHFETDLYIFNNLSMDTLDYTGPNVNEGSKGVLLGLGEKVRELPRHYEGGDLGAGFDNPQVFCGGCLVVQGQPHDRDPDAAKRIARSDTIANWPVVILCDDADQCARSSMNFLWTVFTRFEPAADIVPASQRVVRHQVVHGAPIVIDCRMKQPYPEELFCDEETAAKVESRWTEYFPNGGVEMGDSDRAHLD